MHHTTLKVLKEIDPNKGEVSGSFSIDELTPEMEGKSFEERAHFVVERLKADLHLEIEENLNEPQRYTTMNLVTRVDRLPEEKIVRVFLARHEDNLQLYKQVRSQVMSRPDMDIN